MNAPANQRQCGTCTFCCKVMGIAALDKPRNAWCPHCAPGKGCGIYETRPQECRTFNCGWLMSADLGPDWRPDKAKFMLGREAGGRIVVHCDPAAPSAWRRAPYQAQIKSWLSRRPRQEAVVLTGNKVMLLAPEGEYDLGERGPADKLVATYAETGGLVAARLVREGEA